MKTGKQANEKTSKETSVPDPQAAGDVTSRYYAWLVARETKRLQGMRRWHWVGKKIASSQA